MGRWGTAFAAFWRCLRNAEFAEGVGRLLAAPAGGPPVPAPALPAPPAAPAEAEPAPVAPAPVPAGRSEALTLLSVLQREGRLLDFLQEPLNEYTAEQIRGVVLDVHRDCGKALERMFAVRPATADAEGADVTLPVGFDAGRYRLAGEVRGPGPHRGTIVHPGWEATKCDVPLWTGAPASARVLAPVEVEPTA